MRSPLAWLLGLAAIASTTLGAGDADARRGASRFALEPPAVETTRAFRYAALSSEACLAELDARGFPYQRVAVAKKVETPLRFTGPIRGVTFKPSYRAQPDALAPATIADCRLALAIDDLAQVLRRHDVVEAEYLSMYRPNGYVPAGRRHPSALAIDLATVKLSTGATYSVRHDFHGRVGAETCGAKAAKPTKDTPGALFFREVVCDLAEKRSFNLLLTPNYNWGHRDHFHMEVRTGIRWYLTH